MLPHFCAAGACIHVMIIALYICQRNILIVCAFFDAVAFCISSEDKRERTVAGCIAGCSEAVLKCKYSKHKGSSSVVKSKHTCNKSVLKPLICRHNGVQLRVWQQMTLFQLMSGMQDRNVRLLQSGSS